MMHNITSGSKVASPATPLVVRAGAFAPPNAPATSRRNGMHSSGGSGPSIWVLLTHALGDNDQCIALADLLDEAYLIKRIQMPSSGVCQARGAKRRRATELLAPAHQRLVGLEAPWPDLVIGCGALSDRVALWIKRKSGGRTRVILVGRPHGPVSDYDLVVASPQFFLPPRENVFYLSLPLSRMARPSSVEMPDLRSSAPKNKSAWPELTEPWFTILLGGHAKQLAMAKANLQQVVRDARAAVDHWGGSVVVLAGRRSSSELIAIIEKEVPVGSKIHRWSEQTEIANPYQTVLRRSSVLFVTADSASMIADACLTGKPTFIIDYPDGLDLRGRIRRWVFRYFRSAVDRCERFGWRRQAYLLDHLQDWLHARGILRFPRDLRRLHERVYEVGLAKPSDTFEPSSPFPRKIVADAPRRFELHALATRCRALTYALGSRRNVADTKKREKLEPPAVSGRGCWPSAPPIQ